MTAANEYTEAAKASDLKVLADIALAHATRHPNWVAEKMRPKSTGFKPSGYKPGRRPAATEAILANELKDK